MKLLLDAIPKNTLEQLQEGIEKFWNELSFETINSLIDSLPARMKLGDKGGETVYTNEPA